MPLRLATKTDYTLTASELLQAASRGRRHVSENGRYMAGELEAMGTGDGSGNFTTSLFALTVLSGKKEAVEWAARFVVRATCKEKKGKEEVSKLAAAWVRALPSLAHG